MSHRCGELVSLERSLVGFRIQSGARGKGTSTIQSLDGLEIVDILDETEPGNIVRLVKFRGPLPKGKSTPVATQADAYALEGQVLDRIYSWTTTHRVDLLTIRVVFASNPPKKVSFKVQGPLGVKHHEEMVDVDQVNYQAQKTIHWPRHDRSYCFSW